MRRGTAKKTAIAIDDALGDLGTSINGDCRQEFSELGFEVLQRNLDAAMSLLADVARNPNFPQEEVDREKKKRLDALAQAESEPNGVAARLRSILAFGPGNPYGHPAQGFISAVEKFSREDLAQFHDRYWKPRGSVLILSGDITLAAAVELAKKNFGDWSGAPAPAPTIPAPRPVGPGKVFLVDRPNAAQTVVAEILPAPARNSPDYDVLSLANQVWGGAAGARLGMNIREEKGYSYGVFSFPAPFTKYGLWVATGGVQTNKTKESVVEFNKELKFIAGEKPVTDKEFADAKHERIRGYAQQFESMGRVVDQIRELWVTQLPMTELQREPEVLEKTSLGAVNTIAQKYAAPTQATLLLVGDLSKIEEGVRSLNLGEVVVLNVRGEPVKSRNQP
jgi:zinc protease